MLGRTREEALRPTAAIAAFLVTVLMLTACGDDPGVAGGNGVVVATVGPTEPPTAPSGSATTPNNGTAELHGFVFPVAGACLPRGDQLMPNAARDYRNGVHEGIDFYSADSCTAVARGTPVAAVKAGRVVRADRDYRDMTRAELDFYLANPNTEEALDKFRGRQVWIDHGGGVLSRYAHLEGIATGLAQGTQVSQGQVIAYVGESGTPESLTAPGSEYHLHFELRVGDSYLGRSLAAAEVRRLYETLFSP